MPMTLVSISKASQTPPYLPAWHPHPHEWRCFSLFYPKKSCISFPLKHKYILTLQPKSSVVCLHKIKSIQRWSFPRNSNLADHLPQPKSPAFVQETIRARWCHLTTNNLLCWQRHRLLIARNHAPQSLYLQAQVHNWPREVLGDQS